MMKSWLTFGAVSVCLWITGCMQTAANPLADVTGFCEQKAKAECQVTAVCAIDPTTCISYRLSLCKSEASTAIAGGTRTYMSGEAQACIDSLNSVYGNNATIIPMAVLEGPGSITDKCNRVFSGSVAVNQTCTSDYDCANNRICSPVAPGATVRVCADAVPEGLTGFCNNPGSICAADTYCAPQSTGAAQCTMSAALGAACGNGVPCVSTAQCAGATCVMREAPGGGCTSDDECGSTDPYCDPNSSVCAIGLTFAQGSTDCRAFVPGADGGSQMVAMPTADSGAEVDAADGSRE